MSAPQGDAAPVPIPERPEATEPSPLGTPTKLVLALFALALVFATKDAPGSWADGSRLGTIQALVEQHTLFLDDTDFLWQGDKVRLGDRFLSHQPPMLALLGALPYGLLHHGLGRAIDDPFTYRVLTWSLVGLPLFCGLFALARLLALARLAETWRAGLLFAAAFGTLAFPYALVLNQHGTAAGLFLLALYAIQRRRYASAGLALALASTIDMTAAIAALACLWPVLRNGGLRGLGRYALAALPPVALVSGLNLRLVGDLVPVAMHAELFEYPLSPFMLMELTGVGREELAGTQLAYLWGALFGQSGIFSHHPLLLLFLGLGLGALVSRPAAEPDARGAVRAPGDPYAAGLLGAVLLASGGIAAYYLTQSRNFGGSAFGMRWFAVFAPALSLLPVPWLARRSEAGGPPAWFAGLAGLLLAWSVGAALLGSVQPWMKFAYFWHQKPQARLAQPGDPIPTWGEHLKAEWRRATTFRQDFSRQGYELWFVDILFRHGRVRSRTYPSFTPEEQEAWTRDGLERLHRIVDLLDREDGPRFVRAIGHFWLGKLYRRLGEPDPARRELEAALKLEPGYGPAEQSLKNLEDAGPSPN